MPENAVVPTIPVVPSLWRFPAHPASVGRARQVVAEVLPCGLTPQLVCDLALLTSELVTNAIRYGSRPEYGEVFELIVWPANGHYWIAVSDAGFGNPALAAPDPGGEGGRGLLLVDELSAVWAVVPRRTRGKTVVAGVRVGGAGVR